MAHGDIKKMGILKYNNYTRPQNAYFEVSDETTFTFVDTTSDSEKWEWIEATVNGTTAYIAKSGALHHIAPQTALNCCKNVTLDSVVYQIALLPLQFWLDLDSTIISKMNLTYFSYLHGFTSDTFIDSFEQVKCETFDWAETNENEITKGTSWNVSYGGQNLYYWPALIPVNSAPTISGTDTNLGNKTAAFSVSYSVSDTDSGQELTVIERINETTIRTLKNPAQNSTLTLSVSEEMFAKLTVGVTNTIEIEVTDGSATSYRRYTFVKTNSVPIILYQGELDLGELIQKPTITYRVSDSEGDAITVTEKLNGAIINTFTASTDTDYTVGLTDLFWQTCGNDINEVEIIASDPIGGSSSKTIYFSRAVTKVQIITAQALETDIKASRILLSVQWTTDNCTCKAEVCNNGFDENPIWEDATSMVLASRPYTFQNASKQSSEWGIKIRLTVVKNEGYKGEAAIYGFGGAYE